MAGKNGRRDLSMSRPVGLMSRPVVPHGDGPFMSASKTRRDALLSATMSASLRVNEKVPVNVANEIATFKKKINDFLSGDESSDDTNEEPIESPPICDLPNVRFPSNVALQPFPIILSFSLSKYASPRRLFDPGKMLKFFFFCFSSCLVENIHDESLQRLH
jgi:hypothetical protein